MNKVSKELFSLAKVLLASDKFYKVIESNKAEDFVFRISFYEDWKFGTKLSSLKVTGDALVKKSNSSLEKLKASFKSEGYVKDVSYDPIINVNVLNGKLVCSTEFKVNVDLTGSGTEYSWDRTISILKRFNFEPNK